MVLLYWGRAYVLSITSLSAKCGITSPALGVRKCVSLVETRVGCFLFIAVGDNVTRFSIIETEVVFATKGLGGCFGGGPGRATPSIKVVLCKGGGLVDVCTTL